jgi:hypothetical protein
MEALTCVLFCFSSDLADQLVAKLRETDGAARPLAQPRRSQ